MKFFYHISIFLSLHLLLWFAITCVAENLHCSLFFYGVFIFSAVTMLNVYEALVCLGVIGLCEDALFPWNCTFGATAFCLIVMMFAFKTASWKNTFRYRPRFWTCVLNGLFFIEITIVRLRDIYDLQTTLNYYWRPAIVSTFIMAWFVPYWMKLLKKYFV